MLTKIARYIAKSPVKKVLYPVADAVLQRIGKRNALRYDLEETILVVCPGRSGSTWLAEIISSLEGSVVIWEPLHVGNNPECVDAGFDWQNYFDGDADCSSQRAYLEKLYSGKKLSTRTLSSLEFNPGRLLNANRFVVKHVNANMALPQIMKWFPVQAVLMIRHPCAVVASQLKHGAWSHLSRKNITIPDGLFDNFPHLEKAFKELETLEELLAFEWAIQVYVPLSQSTPHPWYLTTYERLVSGGEEEVERVFEYLNEPCPETAKAHLSTPSATAGQEAPVRHDENRLKGWTRRLSTDQVDRVLRTVRACGVKCYDRSLTPNEEAFPLRSDQPALFTE